MALFTITGDEIVPLQSTTFIKEGILERKHLQAKLKENIEVILPDSLVLAEEYGSFDESRRRIDLLCLDRQSRLVIIELKRSDDGGHMDLQAIRYAAMVSKMTFLEAVRAYSDYKNVQEEQAESEILEFLGMNETQPESFGDDVRILLVSAEFSKEITTAVMWLREYEIDISCVRIKPYTMNSQIVLDVQQIVPLPEAEDYQIKILQKEKEERSVKREDNEREKLRYKWWVSLIEKAKTQSSLHINNKGSTATDIRASAGIPGIAFCYGVTKNKQSVFLYIDQAESEEKNLEIFKFLEASKLEIESKFGHALDWESPEGRRAKQISYWQREGGYRSPEKDWPILQQKNIETMIRFAEAIQPYLERL